ncbi:Glycosyl transferase family 2 [Succinivibrio dextrinosolvens]|uniref:glycosyltransferase family 2 protein n=1 Tax=Succinivibrio dextrinosolvens TaxID=83771 RepID=UPI0008EFEF9F|nr:glycosyltransferase family 2 protein [Succinivibrio dextrinosolvens]SFS85596.1 Glycosyl transferase family 2 [Succinivibrio dextrinosolvens]
MSIPKISIVVPIYGVEKYLNECVDSILNQTFKDIEVILVDDGSKDRCPQIVDEYAQKDSRVVPIHQENGGYGKAVNHGISVARGEYIGIIESDDWIEPDMFEKLYENAVKFNTDMTKCSFYFYNSFAEQKNIAYDSAISQIATIPDEVFSIENFPELLAFQPSIWACLYRASFIKDIKFLETKSASYQDLPFFVESLCKAQRISFVKEHLVHYRQELSQGSSSIRRDDRLLFGPKQWENSKNLLKKYGKYEATKEVFYHHCFGACLGGYRAIFWKYKKQYRDLLVKLYSDLLTDNTFSYKYFNNEDKKILDAQMKGHIFRGIGLTLKMVRKYLFRLHYRRTGFMFQFLGVQITSEKKEDLFPFPRPLFKIKF